MLTKIYEICDAYESGVGHGQKLDGHKEGPYGKGMRASAEDLNEAYVRGYEEGAAKTAVASRDPSEPVALQQANDSVLRKTAEFLEQSPLNKRSGTPTMFTLLQEACVQIQHLRDVVPKIHAHTNEMKRKLQISADQTLDNTITAVMFHWLIEESPDLNDAAAKGDIVRSLTAGTTYEEVFALAEPALRRILPPDFWKTRDYAHESRELDEAAKARDGGVASEAEVSALIAKYA